MVRARLWPATPQYPRLAFCFEMLDWAEALLLECQVALKDLCKAMQFLCHHFIAKVFHKQDLYGHHVCIPIFLLLEKRLLCSNDRFV